MATLINTVNAKSRLLTDEENESIFHALGYKCQTLATTVADLYCDVSDKSKAWEKQNLGVVCFVKDFAKRSFFIRIYDRKDKTLMWEHDIKRFQGVKFTTCDGCIALTVQDKKVSFHDKDEAETFKQKIEEKGLNLRRVRRQGARNTTDAEENKSTRNTAKKEWKTKLTKGDIRQPADFRHVNHVGWDPYSGLDTKQLEPEMRALFKHIGISDGSQVDKETLDFIYDFIETYGGEESILAEQNDEYKNRNRIRLLPSSSKRIPPPPPRAPAINQSCPPPPPSGRNRPGPPLPPSGRNRHGPPPPPSDRNQPGPPQPPSGRNQPGPPPPPPGRNRPGPPPPPSGRVMSGPPPPPSGRTHPPPPPRGRNQSGPPPPPSARNQPGPPPPSSNENQQKQDSSSTPPLSDGKHGESSPPPQTQFLDVAGRSAGKDNPLKQQIMQLLLHNPTEITNFIYDIVDKRGGVDFIKDRFTGGHSQHNDKEEDTGSNDNEVPRNCPNDDPLADKTTGYEQIPGRSSNFDQVPGQSSTADEVSGRNSVDDQVPGAMAQRLSDFEFSSDVFDGDDDEWDDFNDQIDQH